MYRKNVNVGIFMVRTNQFGRIELINNVFDQYSHWGKNIHTYPPYG